jgi:hypothetical protein
LKALIIVSGIAAPQCGNYDDALVEAKTSAALGCGDPRMAPNGCPNCRKAVVSGMLEFL